MTRGMKRTSSEIRALAGKAVAVGRALAKIVNAKTVNEYAAPKAPDASEELLAPDTDAAPVTQRSPHSGYIVQDSVSVESTDAISGSFSVIVRRAGAASAPEPEPERDERPEPAVPPVSTTRPSAPPPAAEGEAPPTQRSPVFRPRAG